MKILCIWLPHFPIGCESGSNPGPAGRTVITVADGSQKRVLDCSPELEDLRPGMSVQQALSLYEDIELVSADLPRYRSVFNQLLDRLEGKSPLVEGSGMDRIYIGLDGLHTIYPSDGACAAAVRQAVPADFEAKIGISSGKFLAYLAAVYSPPGSYKTLSGDISSFLKDIPCSLLPVSAKSKDRLDEFGFKTLGQVAALEPGPLQAQFGPEGSRLRELASGRDNTPLNPRISRQAIERGLELASSTVLLDVILAGFESVICRAFTHLDAAGLGITGINIWTRTLDCHYWEKTVYFKEPALNTGAVVSRLKRVMENCPQPGPVEQLGIKIIGLGRPQGRQKSLLPEVRARDHFLNDVQQLEFRLGGPQLFKFKEVEPWSRIPERRHVLIPLSR